ncbi:MAG: DNA-3-methyladenine glycosylase II [uncultured archaeon A07HB70]|nr:MAG: DNA-3-methyladenine glycosylase II [uncultured archaeon A07HB70]
MTDGPTESLRVDPVTAALVDRYGVPTVEPVPSGEGFRRLARSVCSQSVSTAAARAVRERLFALPAFDDGVTAAATLAADQASLAAAGLGERKADYLRAAATAWVEGRIDRATLADADEATVRAAVTDVYGLGEWTASIYLLFVLGRPDVFPVGDLAVRRAMTALYGHADDDHGAMRATAERWAPHRSHATRLLWTLYEDDDETAAAFVAD